MLEWTRRSSTRRSAFAQTRETNWPRDFSTQEKIFGTLLGPIPKSRAGTNGLIIRHGYVVGEFGDTNNVAPTYSVAKSMLATVAGVAVRERLITNLDSPVGLQIKDGGYDSRAEHEGHLEEPPAAGDRVGRRDVGEEARLRRHRRVR